MSDQLVDVSGKHVHVISMGEGTPAVVLISGAGGLSVFWHSVQSAVAAFTRVYSYDRPGYLSSDSADTDTSLTTSRAAYELHALLHTLSVAPPFVLVGHSFGGFIVRLFAARYPNELAGAVLLDADHEDEWTDRYPPEHRKGLQQATSMMKGMVGLSRIGIPQLLMRLRPPESLKRLPPEIRRAALPGFGTKTLGTIAREFESLEQSAAEVRQEAGILGEMPLIVIRRGKPGPVASGVSREQAEHLEQLAIRSQEELAALSRRGELWVARESGHDIHLEQPELVVRAIRAIVEQIRQPRAE